MSETAGRRGLVVIADDERDIVELVAIVLGRAGYEVLTAADGAEALELARDRLPDLCVLDGIMAGLAGFEVLRELRGDERTAAVRVLILTATVDEEREIRRHGVEPDAFIQKPFDAETLLAEVERLLNRAVTVELLWWRGCPSAERAIEIVREQMALAGLDPESLAVREIVDDQAAEREDFPGSPTIRIDGRDIQEPGDEPGGLTCRVYRLRDGRISALPDPADVAAALAAAREGSDESE